MQMAVRGERHFCMEEVFYPFWHGAKENTPTWEGEELYSPWKKNQDWVCQLWSLLREKEQTFLCCS